MRSYGWFVLSLGVLVLAFLPVPACATQADQIKGMQYFLGTEDTYYNPGVTHYPDPDFFVYEDSRYNGVSDEQVGWLKVDDGADTQYEIREGAIELSDARLIEDLSYTYIGGFIFPETYYVAKARFDGTDVTITIDGTITAQGSTTSLYTGTLIEATATSATFLGKEREEIYQPDFIDFQIYFETTGGFLADHQNALGFYIPDTFYIDIELRECSSSAYGGDIRDFSADIGYAAPSYIHINPIYPTPEPATILLIGLGSAMALRRKRK